MSDEKEPTKLETVNPIKEKSGAYPPWYQAAKNYKGMKESDPKLARALVPFWKRCFGIAYTSLIGSSRAWCGLAMAACLAIGGMSYQKNGAAARNWATYGVGIDWKRDGIPRGAIIHINHAHNCESGKNNHVAQADGDCTAAELLKAGATINLYGGNQGDTWKVSTFSVKEICEVRWPKEQPLRGKITTSDHCTAGKTADESTR